MDDHSYVPLTRAAILALLLSLVACNGGDATDDDAGAAVQLYESDRSVDFPPEMEPYRSAFEASRLDYAAGTASPGSTGLLDSKLLGKPYLPQGYRYPVDVDGKPLQLLAQVNLDDIPSLPDFPEHGILQFYISPALNDEQIWGMRMFRERNFNADNYVAALQQPDYFRVLYHAQVDAAHATTELPRIRVDVLPVNREARLQFAPGSGHVTEEDFRFAQVFGASPVDFFEQFGDDADAVWEQYFYYVAPRTQVQLGGYAAFSQDDPRNLAADEDWLLLLQIDSFGTEDGMDVLWGDAGVGSFHIRRDDLLRLDFSRVLYSWDSH